MKTLSEFASEHGITVADWTTHGFQADESGWEHQRWTFHLTREENGREAGWLEVPYRTGLGIEETPTVEDILNAVALDAMSGEDGFEEFCQEFGYDTDSRRAYATWEACVRMLNDLREFLGSQELVNELLYNTERL